MPLRRVAYNNPTLGAKATGGRLLGTLIHIRIVTKKTSLFSGEKISSNALNAEFLLKLRVIMRKFIKKLKDTVLIKVFYKRYTFQHEKCDILV